MCKMDTWWEVAIEHREPSLVLFDTSLSSLELISETAFLEVAPSRGIALWKFNSSPSVSILVVWM